MAKQRLHSSESSIEELFGNVMKQFRNENGISHRDLDAIFISKARFIGFKWATGHISSSHRAINKLLLAMQAGGLLGVFLVVPSDNLKTFLTDRIWNIGELRPYLLLWSSIPIKEGVLRVEVVEHNATSSDVPRIGIS